MALAYVWGKSLATPDELIEEGLTIKARTEHGWDHQGIANLAHNHGVPAYKEEFRSIHVDTNKDTFAPSEFKSSLTEYGIEKIVSTLCDGGLVIASVLRGLKADGTFHSILIVGYEEGGGNLTFVFHDPDAKFGQKSNLRISKDDFVPVWRNMAIFIAKKSL